MHMRSLLQACQRQDGVTKQKNASNYFATALLNKRTRTITFGRRYQTKEREQLLLDGVTKQKNANNYFWTALPNKRTRTITLQRRFPVIHWIQSDSPGPLRDDSPSQPVQFEQLVEFISRQPKKDCRPAPIAVALF